VSHVEYAPHAVLTLEKTQRALLGLEKRWDRWMDASLMHYAFC